MFDDSIVITPGSSPAPISPFQLSPLAQETRAMVESTCYIHEGKHVGKPFKFQPFQLPVLEALCDPSVKTIVFSVGRKNGKTSLIAALIKPLMIGPLMLPNSSIVCGAMSRDQASLVYKAASRMINMSASLKDKFILRPSIKEIDCPSTGVSFKSLSADGSTAYGQSPRIVILDELGQVRGPTYDLYDALVTAQGAYEDGKVIIISTRPPEPGDLMNLIIDSAKEDPSTRAIVYAAPDDCDIYDERNWYLANPALGKFRSLTDARNLAEKAKTRPSFEPIFRNYILNQKVDPSDAVIPAEAWRSCLVPPEDFPDISELTGFPVYIAADLSSKRDLTALALVWPIDEPDPETGELKSKLYLKVLHYMPGEGLRERSDTEKVPYDLWSSQGWLNTGADRIVDYGYVARDIAERVYSTCSIERFGFDRWRWEEMYKELVYYGVDLEDEVFRKIGQGFQDMNPCIEALETAVVEGMLVVENNPVLNSCLSNSVAEKNHLNERRWSKRKAVRKIDGIVAASMAIRIALDEVLTNSVQQPETSVYETRGLTLIG